MKNIIFAYLSFFVIALFASNSDIDSLIKVLNKTNVDTVKLRLMNELAVEYYYINPDSSLYYSLQVVEKGTLLNTDRGRTSSINRIGLLYLDQANYEEANKYFFQALAIAEEKNNYLEIAYLYNNIGISYSEQKDIENTEKYLTQALKYYNKADSNKADIGIIYNNLSIIAQDKNDFEKQLEYLNKALESYKKSNDSLNIAISNINLASYYRNKNDNKKAISITKQAKELLIRLNSPPYIAKANISLALNYIDLEDYEEALNYLKQCDLICENNNIPAVEMNCNKVYSDLYEKKSNYKLAYQHYNKYSSIKDSLLNEKKQKQISELNVKYETVKKDKEIAVLNKQKELDNEKINTQKKLLIGLIILVSLIVIFSVVLFLLNRRQLLSYKDLVKKNIEIIEKEKEIEKVESTKENKKQKVISEIAKEHPEVSKIDEDPEKYTHSTLNTEQKEKLSAIVLLSMKKDKLFLNQNLTINSLAKEIGINRTYLSQVINEFFNKNFSSFVNEFRIKEASKSLIDDKNITIEAVAFDVGFKSKSAFNNAFKQYTGVTPSFFIKNAKEEQE